MWQTTSKKKNKTRKMKKRKKITKERGVRAAPLFFLVQLTVSLIFVAVVAVSYSHFSKLKPEKRGKNLSRRNEMLQRKLTITAFCSWIREEKGGVPKKNIIVIIIIIITIIVININIIISTFHSCWSTGSRVAHTYLHMYKWLFLQLDPKGADFGHRCCFFHCLLRLSAG